MDNLIQHAFNEPMLLAVFIVSVILALVSVPYFMGQRKRYGSFFTFASKPRKVIAVLASLVAIGGLIYGFTPYVAPPTDEIAIVIGNTKNSPQPSISEDISEVIEATMMLHKGDDAYEIIDSIKLISAINVPEVISLDVSDLSLKEIGNNNSNAKRSANLNTKALEEKVKQLTPTGNGANYLEAVLKAKDNVENGSKIIVIGSGLSDAGDLNFSRDSLLTNEDVRKDSVEKIRDKYGHDYLEGYTVEFYGLGDTSLPQEALSTVQKEIVRSVYKNVIRALGGSVIVSTKTLTGEPVSTEYVVGTTDTGCGDIGLVFDDTSLSFVPNQAVFTDNNEAKNSLRTISSLWDKYKDTIQSIQVDGYIAPYAGVDSLSQPRAELVKSVLVEAGVPSDRITAMGRGVGPYPEPSQNRIVKVTISRDSDQCAN